MNDATSEFAASLADLAVTLTRTTAAEFGDALREAVEPPAVGVPLPFDGVSLDGTGVDRDPSAPDLAAAVTGVTPASLGIADYGSVVVESSPDGTEPVSLFPDRHVAVVAASDVVPDMPAAVERLGEAFRDGRDNAVVATGPSATADMGELVRGAHGPKHVHVVLLEDR
ncbi:LUD domain-containing protein [Halobacteriaceae archaeon GCM10025711]